MRKRTKRRAKEAGFGITSGLLVGAAIIGGALLLKKKQAIPTEAPAITFEDLVLEIEEPTPVPSWEGAAPTKPPEEPVTIPTQPAWGWVFRYPDDLDRLAEAAAILTEAGITNIVYGEYVWVQAADYERGTKEIQVWLGV